MQCTRPTGGYKLASELNSAVGNSNYSCGPIVISPNYTNTFDCNDIVANPFSLLKAWFLDNDQDSAIAGFSKYYVSCNAPPDGKNYISSEFLNSPVGGNIYCRFKEDCNENNSLENIVQGWYLDGDNDGFPLNNTPEFVQCLKPAGPYKTLSQLTSLNEDCNDTNPAIFPGIWYEDKDGDGLITGNFVHACTKPTGYIFLPGGGGLIDCDDTDARATIVQSWYADLDGDRHGGNRITACKPPVGYFTQFELLSINDCNDNDNKIYPIAPELCDGKDNNCNGIIDELACCPPGAIVFVNSNATGANNGSSWTNAYTKLQDGLELARRCISVTAVWVAKGVYYPDEGYGITDNNRAATFTGKNKLSVIGGFEGNELMMSQRNMDNIPSTVLNGDIVKNGDFRKSYNVVRIDGLDSTFILDGFTITNGNASSPADPLAYQRSGAGMVVLNGNPTISNCYFRGNAAIRGAAIANLGGAAWFTNCVISGNNQANVTVGAVYNSNASPTFLHCTIAANNVGSDIFYNDANVSAKVYNCIIRGATPAISGPGNTLAITSIIQSATVWPGIVNSNGDPLFVNETGRNFLLMPCSPAIDIANAFTFNPVTDVLGAPRAINGLPDIGAFERRSVQVLYVNTAATGNGDGSSWLNAMSSLQHALASNCAKVTQLWVARGTYKPAVGTNRDSAFVMRNNLAIYGGFAGTETLLSQRNWNSNLTILSGDIGVPVVASDNSYNIVRNNNNSLNNTAILDGFTITAGNASSSTYVESVGGAIFNRGGSAVYRNCTLRGNQARVYAGGFFSETGSPLLINSVIAGNVAGTGAGAYSEASTANIINCTFAGNLSSSGGAAFHSFGPGVTNIRSCIMWGNSSGIGLWNNSTAPVVSNTLVQGNYTGTGNLNVDPLFILQPVPGLFNVGDLRLIGCSPAVNAGSNIAMPASVTTDLAGLPRVANTIIDMGAYERQTSATSVIIYVDASARGNNSGENWANAYNNISSAITELNFCNPGTTIQVATGTYAAPLNTTYNFDKLDATLLGGFPAGGGTRNPVANPVTVRGNVQVLKPVRMDGIRVQKQ